ncbi:hypothetical protein BGW42_007771 [Actinomortierella wolfii]|nr:hypothetical protein BGW42_007771 [Actinomortierella wolfii]
MSEITKTDFMAQLTTLDDVCSRLDELALDYLSLVNTHMQAMTELTKHFQEGREQISQAKYIMGPQKVSSGCYDNRMKALIGIKIKGENKVILQDIEEEMQQDDVEQGKLQKQGQAETSGTSGTDSTIQQQGSASPTGGEMHKPQVGSGSTATDDSNDTNVQGKSKQNKNVSRDPLRWFGVFAPAPLRNARGIFRGGLQDVSELATIRLQLFDIERQFRALQQRKAELLPVVVS